MKNIQLKIGEEKYTTYSEDICNAINVASQKRGTGIAKRSPEYISKKLTQGQSVIALDGNKLAGFCYIESWENKKYVANSGLVVLPDYQKQNLAFEIKKKVFELSKKLYPHSKIFGITTSLAVMKINSKLGYKPVTFSELTTDENFWKGCQSCVNFDVLKRTERKNCLCVGMVLDTKKSTLNKNWDYFVEKLHLKRKQLYQKFFTNTKK